MSKKKLDLRKLDPQTYSPKWWKFSWCFSSHGIPIRKKSPNNNKSKIPRLDYGPSWCFIPNPSPPVPKHQIQVKQFEGSQVPRIGWLKKNLPNSSKWRWVQSWCVPVQSACSPSANRSPVTVFTPQDGCLGSRVWKNRWRHPWKFNIAPENKLSEKERIIFQLSFFSAYMNFPGSMLNFGSF